MSSDAYAFQQLEDASGLAGNSADLLTGAWERAERIQEQARETGLAEGRAAGIGQAQAEVASAVGALNAALASVEQLRAEMTVALERDAAELALRLAEQILGGVIALQDERVVDVARNALRRVADRRRIVLIVNPDDLEIMSGAVTSLQGELGGIEHCDVQADRRIGRGGTILRTEAGEIDASIEAQLERAREIVTEALADDADA
jgi:flagellar assembly protein FliH